MKNMVEFKRFNIYMKNILLNCYKIFSLCLLVLFFYIYNIINLYFKKEIL